MTQLEMEQKLRELLEPLGAKLVGVYHDEIVVEAPEAISAEVQVAVSKFVLSLYRISFGVVP